MKDKNVVFVLGLYLPGIDIIKEFQQRNIECIGIDCYDNVPGLWLRNTKTYICPDPEEDEKAWVVFLVKLGKAFTPKPVLMITSDKFIQSLQNNRNLLKKYFYFNYLESNIYKKLHSKKGMYELAIESGLPVPVSIFPNTLEDLKNNYDKIKYPCIIKPIHPFRWRTSEMFKIVGYNKIIKVVNKYELLQWYNKISTYDKDLVIQEIIPGPDENLLYFVSYISKCQKCLGYFCGQKLRITPIHFGSASYMKTVDPQPIKDVCLNFLYKNKYWGPSGIEMKKDERYNTYKLVEVNARFGLWDVIGKKLGVNLFHIAYLDLLGKKVNPVSPATEKYYWLSVTRDISTFLEYKREKLISWIQWIRSIFGKIHFADVYLDEPHLMYNMYVAKVLRKIKKWEVKKLF